MNAPKLVEEMYPTDLRRVDTEVTIVLPVDLILSDVLRAIEANPNEGVHLHESLLFINWFVRHTVAKTAVMVMDYQQHEEYESFVDAHLSFTRDYLLSVFLSYVSKRQFEPTLACCTVLTRNIYFLLGATNVANPKEHGIKTP